MTIITTLKTAFVLLVGIASLTCLYGIWFCPEAIHLWIWQVWATAAILSLLRN